MTSLPLLCARAALDKQATQVQIFHTQSALADYVIICSGQSNRQVQAIAESARMTLLTAGCRLRRHEGLKDGRWIVMDFGDVILHIFQQTIREYYDLESTMADAERIEIPHTFYQ